MVPPIDHRTCQFPAKTKKKYGSMDHCIIECGDVLKQ